MVLTPTKEVDPRVKRTRRLLLQAFTDLLKQKNISSISVQDVTEQATVNRATFYSHFEDKYALMDSWMREEFAGMLARKLDPAATLSHANLRALVAAVFEFLGGFYTQCRLSDRQFEPLFEMAMQQKVQEVLLAWLTGAQPTSLPTAKLETTAAALSWAIFGPAVQWSRAPRTRSNDEMTADVLAVALDALSGIVGPIA